MKKIAFILLVALLFSITACNSPSGSSGSNGDKAYTVKFNSNGGSSVSDVKTSQLTEAPVTTKDGQFFCGWYQDSNFNTAVSYPFDVKNNITLYAKWTNATETIECDDAAVQFATLLDDSYNFEAIYEAFPKTIDIEALAEQNCFVKIEATYDVYYEKNYSLGVGYLGEPKHDVSIVDFDEKGTLNENLPTSTEATAETISIVVSAKTLLKTKYYLIVSTYNTQNLVHFTNIKINFTCQATE